MRDSLSYSKAGVDIDASDAAKREMSKSIDRGDPRVFNRLGAFASLLEGRFYGYKHPVLVMKTEEPGSKQKMAFSLGRNTLIAYDLINHLINDMIAMGARPLYVQDCIICSKLDAGVVTDLVRAMAEACRAQDCVLCGGETSIQPGVIAGDGFVLTATAVGIVDKSEIIDGSGIAEGDVVLAVESNGLHTNGYTLVRKLMERNPHLQEMTIDGERFIDVIMRPHKCYYSAIRGLFPDPDLKGIAHITGGGIQDNLKRVLPDGCDAEIDLGNIRIPEVFKVIQQEGAVPQADMMRTFNMGVGLVLVCSPQAQNRIASHLSQQDCLCYPIGRITRGSGKVVFCSKVLGNNS